ncbi:MAG: restriction endonuclease [Acidobacteriia bacterium]|nr:restriction endonuclease [Terriglobia bacterium]
MGIHLTLDDVTGLLHGDEEACRHILEFANTVAWHEGRMKGIEETEDIAMDAVVEAVKAVHDRECTSPKTLERVVMRTIWQESQRTYHRSRKEADVPLELVAYVDSHFDPELAPTEDLELRHPRLIYADERPLTEDSLARIDLLAVDRQLLTNLSTHPERMYELNPRRFEELVAAILSDLGYVVQLTAQGADGGIDIIATQKTGVGEVLLLVDCKRYSPPKKVGVEIVRSLFGIGEQRRATMTMLATTSYFTAPAQVFQRTLRHRLALKDYDDLVLWISEYGTHK